MTRNRQPKFSKKKSEKISTIAKNSKSTLRTQQNFAAVDIKYELSGLVVSYQAIKAEFFEPQVFFRLCCWNSTDLPDFSLLLVKIKIHPVPLEILSINWFLCYVT